MSELLLQAEEYLKKRYVKPMHTVAAALETTSGVVYLGINIDHFSGYVCAETSALAEAMNAGESTFRQIVAVRKEPNGETAIANPCGKCRQIFHDYAPNIQVIVRNDSGENEAVSIEGLLPYSFKRQREKIQNAFGNQSSSEVVG